MQKYFIVCILIIIIYYLSRDITYFNYKSCSSKQSSSFDLCNTNTGDISLLSLKDNGDFNLMNLQELSQDINSNLCKLESLIHYKSQIRGEVGLKGPNGKEIEGPKGQRGANGVAHKGPNARC